MRLLVRILKEIKDRLTFLNNVGLNYLTLSRSAEHYQVGRVNVFALATQIGSNLSGVLYNPRWNPSIGLHQRDNDRARIASLKKMRDLGNTLIVEHDEDTMREADYLIDVGPEQVSEKLLRRNALSR